MRTFKELADERLDGLHWDVNGGMRSLLAPKRRLMMRGRAAVALVLALALMAATALAVGVTLSRRVEMKHIARHCVMDAYGLDEETMSMFTEDARETADGWVVTYSYWQPDVGGMYTVNVDAQGHASAQWSLEGQAGAWGQPEIAAYMAQKKQEQSEAAAAEPLPTPTPAPMRMDEAQALEAAHAAMKQRYHMTDRALESFRPWARQESGLWIVEYNCVFWPEGTDKIGAYTVKLNDADSTVMEATWTLDGAEITDCTRATLAQAETYGAQALEWVAEYTTLYQASEAEWPMAPETAAALDALMVEMGFDRERYCHVRPQEGDLTLTDAKELFYQVIHSEFGVTRQQYEASEFAYTDLLLKDGRREWYFWLQNMDDMAGWTVVLDAQNGEVLDLFNESLAAGNG